MTDTASYLAGYIGGYRYGFVLGRSGVDIDSADEEEGGSASGDAVAPTAAPAPDLPGATRQPSAGATGVGSSRASAPSSLPALRQEATPPSELDIAREGELIHRGLLAALVAMAEAFTDEGMPAAASMCRRAFRIESQGYEP